MALSQSGASYQHREHIKDPYVKQALDDIASQVQAVATGTNSNKFGQPVAPPHAPTAVSVTKQNGFASIAITHNNPPAGSQYIVEMSTSPQFTNPMQLDNGISKSTPPIYLKGQTLYFRAATKFSTSGLSSWVYFGTQANPTAISF